MSKRKRAAVRLPFLAAVFLAFPAATAGELLIDIGRGPVTVHIPSSYDAARPTPLVLNLHGYSNTGAQQEAYFQLIPLSEQRGFLYAYPQGLSNFLGDPYWNGTEACCDLFNSGVDDSTYLSDLADAIRDQLNVDPWRVHFMGFSNGGFMSYRMACDHGDLVASLTSNAGATFIDPTDCQPAGPVHVLQVHGTADGVIQFGGGNLPGGSYPGAVATVEIWARYNECSLTPDHSAPDVDVAADIPGAESTVRFYPDCVAGGSARLWRVPGAPHGMPVTDDFRTGIVDFALSHPKAGLVFSDKDTLTWPPLRWAQDYRVYRGAIADLVDTDGDGVVDPGYGDCDSADDPDPTDTSLVVADTPMPGSGYFYVLGFVDGLGAASALGTASNGSPRSAVLPCP